MCFKNVSLQKNVFNFSKKKKQKKCFHVLYTFNNSFWPVHCKLCCHGTHISEPVVAEIFELLNLSLDLFSKYM